nr:hypothetical protein [Providencia burhodogranariea]
MTRIHCWTVCLETTETAKNGKLYAELKAGIAKEGDNIVADAPIFKQ